MNEVLDVSMDRAEVMFAGEENKYILMFDLKIEILCSLDISNAERISYVWVCTNTADRYRVIRAHKLRMFAYTSDLRAVANVYPRHALPPETNLGEIRYLESNRRNY
jgi:hypothetical protein